MKPCARHWEGRNSKRQNPCCQQEAVHDGILYFPASIIIKEKKSRWPGSAFLGYVCEKILSISFSMRGLSVNLHLQLNGDCSIESLFLIFHTFHLSSTRRMATSSYSRHPRWPLNRCEQASLTDQTRPWSVKSRNRT